jgi:hypothetical protein
MRARSITDREERAASREDRYRTVIVPKTYPSWAPRVLRWVNGSAEYSMSEDA